MPFSCRKSTSFLLLCGSLALPAHAVSNNVRRDNFKWMTVRTAHFDIYYDRSTERLVPRMAHYLEAAWHDVGDRYQFYVPERTPFFFYSNHNEFEQTNIVDIGEGTGGVTEAFKNRFLIFNDGSEEWLQHVIYHEFTHVVQFNIVYGGWWKSIRLLKSPFYALWMMEGSAEYGSGSVDDATGDMVVRDAFANGNLPILPELQGFAHLKPNQVTLGYKTGDAAMEFFEDEYGIENLRKFIFNIKDFFDVSSALESVLGTDLNRFDFRFREWLGEKYGLFLKSAKPAKFYGEKLTPSDKIPQFNEAPVFSKDGRKIYFFSDRSGPHQVYELDLEKKESRPLVPLKYLSYENLHTRGRAMSLSADGRWLAFSGEKKQRDFLYLLDLTKNRLKKIRIPFDELRTPVFSPVDPNLLVCVGMERGVNDLYLIDRGGHVKERLTDTPQDEKDPVFSTDGAQIFFSGEVMTADMAASAGRNIFALDVKTKRLDELTSDIGSELEPEPLPDGSLVFVRDRDDNSSYGFNLIRRDASGAENRLTNFVGGGFSPRWSQQDGKLFFIGFDAGEKHIYKSSWTFETTSKPSASVLPAERTELGFGEARKKPATALLTFPTDNRSPLFTSMGKPYRFKASTDLFIPFFFYSSLDGFVLMDVWQFSDLLGNHQFQQQAQYASGGDVMDLTMIYTYARFRPTFSIGARSIRYYRDFDQNSQRRELTGFGVINYPFDRVTSATLGTGWTDRKDVFLDASEDDTRFHDRFLIGGLQYDTVTGRYLVPTKGARLGIYFQEGFESLGGEEEYKTGLFEASKYIPIPRESAVASRFFYGRSTGEDHQVFRLGGFDKIRGVSSGGEANKKSNVALGSVELRLRIKYLNARTGFLFPDFFFKAAYLHLFDDIGYGWNDRIERDAFDLDTMKNTAGVGISWPTFILQSFQINFSIQWAHRTDNGSNIWYISAGPSF